jgi:hypothetical protein
MKPDPLVPFWIAAYAAKTDLFGHVVETLSICPALNACWYNVNSHHRSPLR